MNEDVIRSEIEQGIAQVDKSLSISDFACVYNERQIKIGFKAKRQNDEAVEVNVVYGN